MMIQDTAAARCSGSVPSAPHSPTQHLAATVNHAPPFPTHLLQNPSICLSSCVFIHCSLLSRWSLCHGKGSSRSALEPRQTSLQASTQQGCCLMSLADGNRLACWQGSPCWGCCASTPATKQGSSLPCRSTVSPRLCSHLTVSSFPSAGPSDPHTEATPQKPPDL